MTQRPSIVAAALFALAGCEFSSSPSTVAQPLASAAPAAPAATGEPISPGNRPAFCRGEASAQYGVGPAYIQTSAPATAGDGSISIDGTANQGADGKKAFRCRFDSSGRFIDVMAMTSDGALWRPAVLPIRAMILGATVLAAASALAQTDPLPLPRPLPGDDFADGLQGGPDFCESSGPSAALEDGQIELAPKKLPSVSLRSVSC